MMVTTIIIAVASLLCAFCSAWCYSGRVIVLNEIMYGPRNGEPEWIEIYNNSAEAIELSGWTIEDADSTKPRLLSQFSILLESGGYACVVQDSSDFFFSFPMVSCPVLQPLIGWPRLNNTGDRIVLRDPTGQVIDEVKYENQWGGGDGKSLERIHFNWPSKSSGTWSASVSPHLATPCAPNSIFASSPAHKAVVYAEPDPFDTKTTISYRLSVPTALVKLEIYDIRGRLVSTLIDQKSSGSAGTAIWNGTDDTGKRLRMGVYVIYLEAIHAQMGVLERAKKTITLAAKLD